MPVYDYVLVTEPLSAAQRDAIGWEHRQGIGDGGNQFHYYRLTADDRILWGGYDAVYRYGGPVGPRHDEHDATFATLAQHFFHDLPAARGRALHPPLGRRDRHLQPLLGLLRHRARRPRRLRRRLHRPRRRRRRASARRVALDLLDGRDTEATRLRYVRSKPVPFPPEPLRYGGDPAHPQPARARPTATPAAAASGCARSTASASASTLNGDSPRLSAL